MNSERGDRRSGTWVWYRGPRGGLPDRLVFSLGIEWRCS